MITRYDIRQGTMFKYKDEYQITGKLWFMITSIVDDKNVEVMWSDGITCLLSAQSIIDDSFIEVF